MSAVAPRQERYFNPRSHEGSDQLRSRQQPRDQISILAPTRGATSLITNIMYCWRFQSSLPRGERRLSGDPGQYVCRFQSSLPRGERLRVIIQSFLHTDFNPRSHEGSDGFALGFTIIYALFHSSLPRGERPELLQSWNGSHKISILAPTRGATAIFAKKFSFLSAKIV